MCPGNIGTLCFVNLSYDEVTPKERALHEQWKIPLKNHMAFKHRACHPRFLDALASLRAMLEIHWLTFLRLLQIGPIIVSDCLNSVTRQCDDNIVNIVNIVIIVNIVNIVKMVNIGNIGNIGNIFNIVNTVNVNTKLTSKRNPVFFLNIMGSQKTRCLKVFNRSITLYRDLSKTLRHLAFSEPEFF